MVGERLKSAVSQSRMTPEEAAKGLGISVSNLYTLYKKESFNLEYVKKASKLFDVPISYFLENEMGSPTRKALESQTVDSVLKEITEELKMLREQLNVKDQQIAGLQRTVDALVGKCEGAIDEPLFSSLDGFEKLLHDYELASLQQVHTLATPFSVSKPVAK